MTNAPPNHPAPDFDVIIIGAGINGAGIARDAAMRGLKVLLLDKGDIGSGTSSWSTRLIHGGLRYLEHREFGLVRESLRERERLLVNAPHLVRPLKLVIPIYENARRGRWTMQAGMLAYDVLSFEKSLPRHQMLSRAETLAQLPGLNHEGLLAAAVYYDAQVEYAERLVFENALSAVRHGATVVTYARVERLIVRETSISGVEFVCGAHGQAATATLTINAAGPWIDNLLTNCGAGSPRLIGGTKGSHIIVGPFRGAPADALYVEASTDQRPFFIIPWNGQYLIGTTDIRYSGDLDDVRVEDDEMNYLLGETNRVIPAAGLTHADIRYAYAGVRPLPFTGDEYLSSMSDEQSTTRRHFIRVHPEFENLLSIVGGKLTTFRSLAEETVDLIFRKMRRDSPACATARSALPGADTPDFRTFCKNLNQHSGFSDTTIDHLLRTYGVRATEVLKLAAADSSLAEVLDDETGAIAAEVVFAFRHELAQTLGDCLLRRTMVGLNSTHGLNAVEAAAGIAQRFQGWTNHRATHEVALYRDETSRQI